MRQRHSVSVSFLVRFPLNKNMILPLKHDKYTVITFVIITILCSVMLNIINLYQLINYHCCLIFSLRLYKEILLFIVHTPSRWVISSPTSFLFFWYVWYLVTLSLFFLIDFIYAFSFLFLVKYEAKSLKNIIDWIFVDSTICTFYWSVYTRSGYTIILFVKLKLIVYFVFT